MSDTINRDTQFAGFAAQLLRKIDDVTGQSIEQELSEEATDRLLSQIIANWAHDLVVHAVSFVTEPELRRMWAGMLSPGQVARHIPDLTELPEEGSQ